MHLDSRVKLVQSVTLGTSRRTEHGCPWKPLARRGLDRSRPARRRPVAWRGSRTRSTRTDLAIHATRARAAPCGAPKLRRRRPAARRLRRRALAAARSRYPRAAGTTSPRNLELAGAQAE